MIVRLIAALMSLVSIAAIAQSQELATCRNPTGKAYRHFSDAQDKADSGWHDERISIGVVTLVQASDGSFDMLYVDVRNKPISMMQDGAKVVLLRRSADAISLLAHYEGATTEIYSFFREKDGKSRYTVMTSRVGSLAISQKSSVMVGDCDPILFYRIK